jgi:hypothetical protein
MRHCAFPLAAGGKKIKMNFWMGEMAIEIYLGKYYYNRER